MLPRLFCSPEVSVLFSSDKRQLRPFRSVSAQAGNPVCIIPSAYWQARPVFIYEAQATKGTVSDFRIMKLSNHIGRSSTVHRKGRESWPRLPSQADDPGQWGPVTATVSLSTAVLAETGPLSAQTLFFLLPPCLPSISSVVCKLNQVLCFGLFIHTPKVENA